MFQWLLSRIAGSSTAAGQLVLRSVFAGDRTGLIGCHRWWSEETGHRKSNLNIQRWLDFFFQKSDTSATSSPSSSACAKKTASWECTAPDCCLRSPSWSTRCPTRQSPRWNPLTRTSPATKSASSRRSRTLIFTRKRSKKPKIKWGTSLDQSKALNWWDTGASSARHLLSVLANICRSFTGNSLQRSSVRSAYATIRTRRVWRYSVQPRRSPVSCRSCAAICASCTTLCRRSTSRTKQSTSISWPKSSTRTWAFEPHDTLFWIWSNFP